jgi:hypothetical protein
MYSIDEAIADLQKAKKAIGGDKVLVISLSGSGLDVSSEFTLATIKNKDSKYVEVRVEGYDWLEDHVTYDA